MPRGDLDLRISAARLTADRLTLQNAALSVLSRNGRLDINLSNAEATRAPSKAATCGGGGRKGRRGQADRFLRPVGQRRGDAGTRPTPVGYPGLASGSFVLEGGGESPLALMRSLEGRLGFWVRQGEIAGINLPDVLKRIERRPLNALDVKGGRTVIESGGLNAKVTARRRRIRRCGVRGARPEDLAERPGGAWRKAAQPVRRRVDGGTRARAGPGGPSLRHRGLLRRSPGGAGRQEPDPALKRGRAVL